MTQSMVTLRRFTTRWIAFRLFFTCWLVYSMHFATNIVREIYPAVTLGDHLSFNVYEYLGLHPDIFQPDPNIDRAFINSNPGASIIGAIPYAVAQPLIDQVVQAVNRYRAANPSSGTATYDSPWPMAREFYRQVRQRGLDVKLGLAAGVMQALAMAPLSALSVVVMFWILVHLTSSVRTGLLLALLYAFATPVFYRTAFLNHNVLLGHFSFFSFALLWRPWDDYDHPRSPSYLLAGLLCGWTIVLDYSGIVAVFSITLYAIFQYLSFPRESRSIQYLILFFVGVVLCGVVLITYQWLTFGHPFYPAQHYMPHTEFSQSGYHGMTWPTLHLLFQTAFSGRYGLFTSAPILLLVFCLPFFFQDIGQRIGGKQLLFILIYGCGFFLFCSANQFGLVQFNTGVRHIVPVTPFLFLIVAMVIIQIPKVLAVSFSIISLYWSWCLAMYRDVELGLGVLEPLIHITVGGFQLPWLSTLNRIGYFRNQHVVLLVFLMCGVVIWGIWTMKSPSERVGCEKSMAKNDESK